MARFHKSRFKAKGAAPGSLIFMGHQKMESISIRLFNYNEKETIEKEFDNIEDALKSVDSKETIWLNIDGIHDTDVIKKVGEHFKVSNIALENILNTGQRSKYFEDKNSITVITKAIYYDSKNDTISVEQISFILLNNILISFQEKIGDHFEPVRERIRNSIGKIRRLSSDYLMYALIDTLVDNYHIYLEQIGEKIEALEKELSSPSNELSTKLYHYKTEVTYFRKTIKPLREVLTRLLRSKDDVIDSSNLLYYEELFDLSEQSIDAVESYLNMTNDLINLYNTHLSNKVNEVMKVLTIFASIFIPLTFIAGVYGTNFDNLPEIHFKYAYFVMWGVMITVALVMLYYFRKNKWF